MTPSLDEVPSAPDPPHPSPLLGWLEAGMTASHSAGRRPPPGNCPAFLPAQLCPQSILTARAHSGPGNLFLSPEGHRVTQLRLPKQKTSDCVL